MTETASRVISVLAGVVALFLAQLSVTPTFAAEYDVGSIHIAQPWFGPRQRAQKRALAT